MLEAPTTTIDGRDPAGDTAVVLVGAHGGPGYSSTALSGWFANRLLGSERLLFPAAWWSRPGTSTWRGAGGARAGLAVITGFAPEAFPGSGDGTVFFLGWYRNVDVG
ncbi:MULTISPECIES: hypothetical protein [Nocardia]|uniref:hypothetical protein n=1 Tax=Nocardia TaxID=1817 RepID=UPI0030B81A15